MRRFVWLVVLAVAVSACGTTGTAAIDIEVGQCFDDVEEELVTTLDLIDCAQPHDNEVYASVFLPGTSFPGDEAIDEMATESCLAEFESYVGESYEQSPLDYLFLLPTAESWQAGERSVLCFLYAADLSKLTGSERAG